MHDVVARHAYTDLMHTALGRPDLRQARALHTRATRTHLAALSPDTALLVHHSDALLAAHENSPDAAGLFGRAHKAAAHSTRPFDRARLHLDHGTWLRRQRDTAAARTHLRTAHDTFTRLQATPWQHLAGAELRAVGISTKDHAQTTRAVPDLPPMSAQEERIARLAAQGLSNREISGRLPLPPDRRLPPLQGLPPPRDQFPPRTRRRPARVG
ncbi:hypothetical protein AB5J52_01260 [Streptomyces sp. R39]|uniref:HTH luxR-type domain-containing protein n=1 Tax=Streptomyces sp. R39 TaxID=3238631 RepID=A0AB39QEC6_9ACTN